MKAVLGSTRPLTETELEYAVGGRPFDVRLYEFLLDDSPERVFRRMIQRHRPPLFPGIVWKYICYVSVFMLLADIYVVFTPNPISNWLIDSFGDPQAALVAFTLLFVFPAVSIASWSLATRRSRTQYPLVPPATGFELLEVPSNDTRPLGGRQERKVTKERRWYSSQIKSLQPERRSARRAQAKDTFTI